MVEYDVNVVFKYEFVVITSVPQSKLEYEDKSIDADIVLLPIVISLPAVSEAYLAFNRVFKLLVSV